MMLSATQKTFNSTYFKPNLICDFPVTASFLIRLFLLFVPGSYSLSIRDLDHNTGEGVKHYRIRNMDNGGFYISAKISFNSLKELVQHHSRAYYGLLRRAGGLMKVAVGAFI